MPKFQFGTFKISTLSLLTIMSISFGFASNAIVSPYANVRGGKGNWGHVKPGYREFITIGQSYRVRQSGDINMVRLYVADNANITGFYIKIWRKGANGYDLIGKSENLSEKLLKGEITYITLTKPIPGVKEGDYCGYRLEGSGGHYAFHAIKAPKSTTYLMTDATPAGKNFNWEEKLKISGVALPIELYMISPQVVFIGDSIIAGCPNNNSFLETGSKTNIPSTIEEHFCELTGYTYQNMGIGSQTTSMIASRFHSDVVRLKPELVIIEGGVNDIGIGKTTKTDFLNNWTTMLESAKNNNILPVVILILPWTNGKTAQMATRDEWNHALKKLAESYNAVIVDASKYVGEKRAGEPEGGLWNIQPQYNADGIHFNSNGHKKIAEAIRDCLKKDKPKIKSETATPVIKKEMYPIAALKFKGKPFFPIGTWAGIWDGKIDQEWLDAGCNFIVYNNIYKDFTSEKPIKHNKMTLKNLKALRDTTEYKDVAVALCLSHELMTRKAKDNPGDDIIPARDLASYVKELNDIVDVTSKYPNVIGYTCDEPENSLYQSFGALKNKQGLTLSRWMNNGLKWVYDTIKKKAPNAYVMPTIAWWDSYMDTYQMYDVLLINSYPVATKDKLLDGNFYDVVYDTLQAVNAVRARRRTSVIFSPPIFNNLKWPPWGKGRAPIYEEQRYMCFAPIAAGAMGLAGWVLYRATPEYRQTVIYPVFREVKRFVPWFLGEWRDEKVTSDHDTASVDYLKKFPDRVMLLPGESMDRTKVKKTAGIPDCTYALRYRKDDNSYLLLAVNNRKEAITVNFKINLPNPKKILETLQVREVKLSNGTLTDKFAPFGVHAYIIKY